MKLLSVLVLFAISGFAHAAELTDSDLLRAANAELSVPEEMQTEGSGATVSTADSLPDINDAPILAPRDVSFGTQSYQPQGMGSVSATETYTLQELSKKPMGVLTISKWFNSLKKGARGLRWGGIFNAGFARSNMSLTSNSGTAYEDVTLTSILPSVGPAVEYFWPVGAGLALGLNAGFGREFLVQSTTRPSANKTMQANFFERGAYARIYFSENIFARLAFVQRSILGSSDIDIQASNQTISFGFGL